MTVFASVVVITLACHARSPSSFPSLSAMVAAGLVPKETEKHKFGIKQIESVHSGALAHEARVAGHHG